MILLVDHENIQEPRWLFEPDDLAVMEATGTIVDASNPLAEEILWIAESDQWLHWAGQLDYILTNLFDPELRERARQTQVDYNERAWVRSHWVQPDRDENVISLFDDVA